MRRPNRIAQAYGFTVCLLWLVAITSALTTIVDAAFKLSDPLRAGSGTRRGSWLSSDAFIEGVRGTLSFEEYRADRLREHAYARMERASTVLAPRRLAEQRTLEEVRAAVAAADTAVPRPTDEELRREFRALQRDTAALRRFHATRLLVSNLAFLAVALVVFATHWRWVNRLVLLDIDAGPLRAA